MLIKKWSSLPSVMFVTAVACASCARDGAQPGVSPGTEGESSEALSSCRGGAVVPPLCTPGDVATFVDWAGRSTVDESELVRRAIVAARWNERVVGALIDEVETAQRTDHSRALLALALLGEMRNPGGTAFLMDFIHRPLPRTGTVAFGGEIVERTAQAMLQAKAVDGIAYLRTEEGDDAVLSIAGSHPSKIVRAEAINAFLWNHGDSPAARRVLAPRVRADEQILIDRVRRGSGEGAASFNAKLRSFLEAHPEVIPPPPERSPEGCRDMSPTDTD